jgi:hypothetical protein
MIKNNNNNKEKIIKIMILLSKSKFTFNLQASRALVSNVLWEKDEKDKTTTEIEIWNLKNNNNNNKILII